MSKFLLLILAVAAAWWLIKRLRGRAPGGGAPGAAPEQMVNCSQCGLYLPQSEAIAEGGEYFCCAEHRRRSG